MADEPSVWELHRTMTDMRGDLKDGLAQINARLDRVVSNELFASYQSAVDRRFGELEKDVAALQEQHRGDVDRLRADVSAQVSAVETRQHAADERRAGDRRLVFTALIAPALLILLQVVLAVWGAGP
ncbi:hypothetical protein [Marinitenerispora sediminis]|uniref:Uncharacterized protein n=1 Tax=Marinitenerispora sediminis TaxID=1931232 RepID=A0A368T6M7_9ACTN|nr:hypothetical protein [Marinitenerispora sediminis]RCV53464.1 hypothetical protein DEF23_17445 [Marinitenerispora sediminis]RCV59292.1 hypothetical protein DEF24_09985 [Marinitenerispora sediminis]